MRRLTSLLTAALLWITFVAGLVTGVATSLVAALASRYVVIAGKLVAIDGAHRQ